MLWNLEHSKHIKLYLQLKNENKPTPLDFAPVQNLATKWYFNVFAILSNSRARGMSDSPIQLSEIMTYYNNFTAIDPAEDFVSIVQSMDMSFLKFKESEIERKNKLKTKVK